MKISGYTANTSPQPTDYVLGNSASGPTTKKFLLSDLVTLFLNNIPAAEGSFGFVSTGLIWTADAAGSTRAATMSLGRVKVNSTFLAIGAVTSRIFTASRDTYVDILDNLDGTGTIVYTEVTNNNASPALAANSIRIAIIVTGATTIATSGSINQGEENKVLPIASSVPYQVTDSLGNLICTRDPTRSTLGYRQTITDFTTSSASVVQLTGLSCPVIVPTGRKIELHANVPYITVSGTTTIPISIWEGTVGSGTTWGLTRPTSASGAANTGGQAFGETTPTSPSKTFNVGIFSTAGNSMTANASSSYTSIRVKLA